MSLVYSQTPSGLVVGSFAADDAAARRALREYDRDLRLVPPGIFVRGEHESRSDAYRVYRYMGSDRDLRFVCGWWDDYGNPYAQLSIAGLLDMVKRLDLNTRGERFDSEAANAEVRARRMKDDHDQLRDLAHEFRGRLEGKRSSPLPRSASLVAARRRERERIKSPELRP